MAVEIERKFLVEKEDWRAQIARSERISQGYLTGADADGRAEVRVRQADERAFLTVKSKGGLARYEFEYEIPIADARLMLDQLCGSRIIRKIRHHITEGGSRWCVDEFIDQHRGLTLAEIELESAGDEPHLPTWLGADVTNDPQYRNANLALKVT